ncbi:hypothetical protein Hanom_Chr12g01072811 [Helianthus anomalus]
MADSISNSRVSMSLSSNRDLQTLHRRWIAQIEKNHPNLISSSDEVICSFY